MECRAETPHFWPPPKMGRFGHEIDATVGLTVARQPDGQAARFADSDRYEPRPSRVRSSGRHRRVCKSGSECIAGRPEGDCFTVSVCRFACRHALTVDFAARVCRPTENAQGRHNSLRHSHWAPLTILESPRLEATLNEHLLPFRHEPFGDFRQLAPGDAADPFDPLDDSFLFVAEGLVDGEREIRNGLIRKCGPHLRIVPGIPEENYLVHSMFDILSAPGRFRCN